MLVAFLSRFIPGFEAACVRLRLNHGKTKDPFGDLRYLIDYYLERGELERAEALSNSLVLLAEGDTVRWTDPERLPARKSLQFKKAARKSHIFVAALLLLTTLVASQHRMILTSAAKYQMRAGHVAEAISLLRAELELATLLHDSNTDIALDLADALICDYKIGEAKLLIGDILRHEPDLQRARYLDLQVAMLTGMGIEANRDAMMLSNSMPKKELISALLFSNVLNGHGPYADFQTMLQLAKVEYGLMVYKKIQHADPEQETNAQMCLAMGYFCKARNDASLSSQWFKQALNVLRNRKFRSDYVRYIDAAKNYVALNEHSKPIESRRLEWTAMGIAKQVGLRYETFAEKSERDELSDHLTSLLQ